MDCGALLGSCVSKVVDIGHETIDMEIIEGRLYRYSRKENTSRPIVSRYLG